MNKDNSLAALAERCTESFSSLGTFWIDECHDNILLFLLGEKEFETQVLQLTSSEVESIE